MTSVALLVGEEVGNPVSGESRFVVNLAKSLSKLGAEVAIYAASASEPTVHVLERDGIRVTTLNVNPSLFVNQMRLLTGPNRLARRLARVAQETSRPDWYVIFDEAVAASRFLEGRHKAFICNGDFALLFVNQAFYRNNGLLKRLLATRMSKSILGNARAARLYDLRFANSKFTQSFMSYVYECPFEGVVYPPVDSTTFYPRRSSGPSPYVLSMMRNSNEQNIPLLERLARSVRLKVVGGAKVSGAESTGYLSDDELAGMYSGASFLAFPVISEFFGYAVAESLACSTPALVMAGTGPAEQVVDGVSGWIADDENDFVASAVHLYRDGYDASLRLRAQEASKQFGMPAVGKSLLAQLKRAESHARTA